MVVIGKNVIGDGNPCFITFEIGPTHEGFESAKRLIKCASASGANAVKFQIFDPDRLVADKKQTFSYKVLKDKKTGETEIVEENLYDILSRRCMNYNEWIEIKNFCDDLGVAFFSTVGFKEDIDLLEKIGCDSIKIASADINHLPLIAYAAKTGACIQIDTGMATFDEIQNAISVIHSEKNQNIIIHHCPSGYPANKKNINLKMIKTIKQKFNYPVAFSDHSPGKSMDIAAVALGANLIEKTITENRMNRSVEHIMSLEPDELESFVNDIREIENALGSENREIMSEELKERNKLRRSAFLLKPAKKGQRLSDCEIEFRRPGYGISPDKFQLFQNYFLNKDIKGGEIIKKTDIDDQ